MDRIQKINIASEMKTSFLDYAMSVIVSRALPDVRDGLKPVHRRILFAMNDLGMHSDKAYKKSARIVGEVIGKYHPHGDSAVYDTMVRMSQDFSYRYPLVDGQGNFGSIDGDGAAAMRYTEARMSKISMNLLRDINKNTINFKDNYDGSEREPEVLPSRFPNLLANGATGIAVGMATNIPPHNITEVIDGLIAYANNNEITTHELMEIIQGPDFPTGATILGRSGIKRAYETGKGSVTIRSKTDLVEMKNGKTQIIVSEIPYQVNKARLIKKIAELVNDKKIEGIVDLRDESNRKGIRIVIELKKDANSSVVLNNLYKQTSLQTSFGINNLSLVNGEPKILPLKDTLKHYLDHQIIVIERRTRFDLEKAENRAHILEGFIIALNDIDRVIDVIKASSNDSEASANLIAEFSFTDRQAKAILEMRLRRLTGLERERIENELNDLNQLISKLKNILSSRENMLEIVITELMEFKDKFGDERRTVIDNTAIDFIDDESLIPVEDIVITLTSKGYIKRLPIDTYKTQNRGGRGVKGATTGDEDYIEYLLTTTTHSYILFMTSRGKTYRLKGYEIPTYSRTAKGLPVVNLLPLESNECVSAIIPIDDFETESYLFFATKNGLVKRTHISEFASIRANGKIALTLRDDDELISVKKTNGNDNIVIGASNGKMIMFNENDCRPMGRTASGVKGLTIEDSHVVGMELADETSEVLVISRCGFGKRTTIDEYKVQNRGGKGVKTLNITEKNGKLISLKTVSGTEDLMIITNDGIVIRMPIDQISTTGRVTQGVKLIRLNDGQFVANVAVIDSEDDSIEGSIECTEES